MLEIENRSDTPFSYGAGDFSLYVDGSSLRASIQVDQPSIDQVNPGETSGVTGGYGWALCAPDLDQYGLDIHLE